jgi:hypothetical protein
MVCEAEIRECLVMAENAWRDEMYPDFGYLYCDIGTCIDCIGALPCESLMGLTEATIAYYDTNSDMNINP